MRVNIYAEEVTERVEIIKKTTEAGEFTGIRFYLELPISVPSAGGHVVTHRGPFIHRPGDDDSSAVTFWGKRDFRKVLQKALDMLDRHYNDPRQPSDVVAMTGGGAATEGAPVKQMLPRGQVADAMVGAKCKLGTHGCIYGGSNHLICLAIR